MTAYVDFVLSAELPKREIVEELMTKKNKPIPIYGLASNPSSQKLLWWPQRLCDRRGFDKFIYRLNFDTDPDLERLIADMSVTRTPAARRGGGG